MIADIRDFIAWARHHLGYALILVMLSLLTSGGYSFVTGYASKFGESFAGEYGQFRQSVETYTVLDTTLQHLLIEYRASRAAVARFHNSVRDLGANSIFFVTAETLVAAPGVAANLEQLRNQPASMYSEILPILMDHKIVLLRTDEIKSTALKELAQQRGVRAALFIPIHDLNDHLIGFLGMSWMNEPDIPNAEALSKMEPQLEVIADRIGAYFSKR